MRVIRGLFSFSFEYSSYLNILDLNINQVHASSILVNMSVGI